MSMDGQENISTPNGSGLVEIVDVPAHNILREKAVQYMFSEGANSCGKELSDVINLIKESAPKKEEENKLEFITTKIIGKIRGRSGEFLSKPLDVGDCPTLYGVETYIPQHELVDPNDYFTNIGGLRKDIILINYFFESEADEVDGNGVPKDGLTGNEIKMLGQDTVYVLNNYGEVAKAWKISNPEVRSNPGNIQLVRWYLQENRHDMKGAGGKQQNKLLDRAFSYIEHRDDEYGNKMGAKTVKSLLESSSEPAYYATTLPDMLIVSPENKTVGVIEVKSYTPEEVKLWLESLRKAVEAENNSKDVTSASMYEAAKYDRRGLQVNILDSRTGKPTGTRLGVNLDATRNFINAANIEPPRSGLTIDTIDNMTFEVFPEHVSYPVILRLPQNIPHEDIKELGALLGELKIRSVAIQQLPFSSDEINEGGYAAFMRTYTNMPKEERVKLNDIYPDLTTALRNRKTWNLPEEIQK